MAQRLTQFTVEALTDPVPNCRVTQQTVEALITNAGTPRITQVAAEALCVLTRNLQQVVAPVGSTTLTDVGAVTSSIMYQTSYKSNITLLTVNPLTSTVWAQTDLENTQFGMTIIGYS